MFWLIDFYCFKTTYCLKYNNNNCGRQVEAAILISRLLLGMRRMYVAAFVWTSTKNEWNVHNAIWSRPYEPSTPRKLIRRVLTICHVKLTQGTALALTCDQTFSFSKRTGKKDTWSQVTLEQKRLDFRSLSPALHNLWLLLVIVIIINDLILVKHNFYFTKNIANKCALLFLQIPSYGNIFIILELVIRQLLCPFNA